VNQKGPWQGGNEIIRSGLGCSILLPWEASGGRQLELDDASQDPREQCVVCVAK
jgi:hypothetical protein